ncbi:MAG: hypothetical protein WCK49_09895 [Myxococcaceae bacterium]
MKKNMIFLLCALQLGFSVSAEGLAERARKAVENRKSEGRVLLSEADAELIAVGVVQELFRPLLEVKNFIQGHSVAMSVSATVFVGTALVYRLGLRTQNNLANMRLKNNVI